jgi:hypothetical protein
MAICLLGQHLARQREKNIDNLKLLVVEMGRISVALSDELEKKLRFKTIERFGGRKGDLSRAVEEAVKTWVAKEK